MNVYMRKASIVGIFPATVLRQTPEEQPFLRNVRIVEHDVAQEEAKACILTQNHELHVSNVNCRTLRQRWNAHPV
jgi:ribosomal protein L24